MEQIFSTFCCFTWIKLDEMMILYLEVVYSQVEEDVYDHIISLA